MTTINMLLDVFTLLFAFWPVLVIVGLKYRGNPIRNMLINWGMVAFGRILLFFDPTPLDKGFLIPEPLNTVVFFLCGAVLGGLFFAQKNWQRGKLLRKAGKVNTPQDLLELSAREFEDMAVELFNAFGHKARRTGQIGDHGVDVEVTSKKGEKIVIQCKRWKGSVGEPVVRDFYGVIMHEKADRGIIITSSKFSGPAQAWVKGKPIALYNGEKFIQLWRKAQARQQSVQTANSASTSSAIQD